MTDVYATYLDALDKTNKEENGYFTVDLFNRLSHVASRHVFNDYQKRLQNPNTAAIEKGMLLDRLFPFIERNDIEVVNGYAEVPEDYAYFSSAKAYFDNGDSLVELNALYSKLCLADEDPSVNAEEIQQQIDAIITNPKMVAVQLLDNEQISRRLNSYVPGKRPSLKKPVMDREGKKFHVYPEAEASLFLWFYRRPMKSLLVMNQTSTMDLQYDAAASDPFEWDAEAINDVVDKIVGDYAIYIREAQLYQMNQANKAETK